MALCYVSVVLGSRRRSGHREMVAAQYQNKVRFLYMLRDLLFVLSQSTFPSIYAVFVWSSDLFLRGQVGGLDAPVHECGRDRLASVGVGDLTLVSQVEALRLIFFLDICIFVVINENKVDSTELYLQICTSETSELWTSRSVQ